MISLIPLYARDGSVRAYARVDQDDGVALGALRWWRHSQGYAARTVAGGEQVFMHRAIMGLQRGDAAEVDHMNGDRLDNRRCNLRLVDHTINCQNVRTAKGAYRGVYFDQRRGTWYAQVKAAGKRHHLGVFADRDQAREAAEEGRHRLLPGSITCGARG